MSRVGLLAATVLLLLSAAAAEACPVCYGDPQDPMTRGMSNGILTLLGFVGAVQVGFIALFINFWRRGKQIRERRESLHLIRGGRPEE